MLYRADYDPEIIAMVDEVVKSCKDCADWSRVMHRPVSKAQLTQHFNDRVQTDLCLLFDKVFVILIDKCLPSTIIEALARKTPDEWFKAFFNSWIRIFGLMRTLVTHQEGAVVSDISGALCEKFDIHLDLGGSQGHTAAPMAERSIQIVQLSALKLWSASQKACLNATQEMCVAEAAMASNLMLF